jgi:protein-tyrosine phosphatase
MKALLIYYSFTGQAAIAAERAAQVCRQAGWEPTLCRVDFADQSIRLRRPLAPRDVKHWTAAAADGQILPVAYDPSSALQSDYDLVLVFSNTWQSCPSVPIRSFLAGAEARRLLAAKPFAVLVICRRLWKKNVAIVQALGEAAGGRFIAGEGFAHPGSQIGSLVQTVSYLMRGGAPWRHVLGVPLPDYGLSRPAISRIDDFVAAVLAKVPGNPPRVAPLEGGHNFRDIGGYPTEDGGTVRWGRVFRSGTMAQLTDEDHRYLATLGIKVICDFRSNRERETRPTRWSQTHTVDLWTRDHESSVGELIAAVSRPGATAADMRERMIQAYRHLPYEQADSFREIFKRISTGDLPLVFHCSAGKDRTGIAAALLLSVLRVPREKIVEDYLLTERFFERGCHLVMTDPSSHRFAHLDPSIWEPMMRAEPAYIESTFETLTRRHGSIDGYLSEVLGVDEQMRTAIRRELIA